MASKLLIRTYDVELGDCIYVRIPSARSLTAAASDDFHILIDCGSKGSDARLQAAVDDLAEMLPDVGDGRKRLDLLVATHEHADHIKGFSLERFERFRISNLWMSAAMDPDHAQAPRAQTLIGVARAAMRGLALERVAMSPRLLDLAATFGVSNDVAMDTLRHRLPRASGIAPVYVHAGHELSLPLQGATIRVLGPENDIDGFYLGRKADEALRNFAGTQGAITSPAGLAEGSEPPANIGAADFRILRSRMLTAGLGFAELASRVQNNSCVVLLIEWNGKRLLFVGDCEWEHSFAEGKQNGGWNVMWHRRRDLLDAPLDFLKIGHHGSINATPWDEGESHDVRGEPADILDAILPAPAPGEAPRAAAIVSTLRRQYETIPHAQLLAEIGARVLNARTYRAEFADAGIDIETLPGFDLYEKPWIDARQPWRTDFERILSGKFYVDIEIPV